MTSDKEAWVGYKLESNLSPEHQAIFNALPVDFRTALRLGGASLYNLGFQHAFSQIGTGHPPNYVVPNPPVEIIELEAETA